MKIPQRTTGVIRKKNLIADKGDIDIDYNQCNRVSEKQNVDWKNIRLGNSFILKLKGEIASNKCEDYDQRKCKRKS